MCLGETTPRWCYGSLEWTDIGRRVAVDDTVNVITKTHKRCIEKDVDDDAEVIRYRDERFETFHQD